METTTEDIVMMFDMISSYFEQLDEGDGDRRVSTTDASKLMFIKLVRYLYQSCKQGGKFVMPPPDMRASSSWTTILQLLEKKYGAPDKQQQQQQQQQQPALSPTQHQKLLLQQIENLSKKNLTLNVRVMNQHETVEVALQEARRSDKESKALRDTIETLEKQTEHQKIALERARLKATTNNKEMASLRKAIQHNTEKEKERDETCKICFDGMRNTAYVPCGHVVCEKCSEAYATKKCPFCREPCITKVKLYNA